MLYYIYTTPRLIRSGQPQGSPFFILMKNTNIYIDGFNLYYGLLKGTSYKWLNIQRCFERMYRSDHIQTINYFTAKVEGDDLIDQMRYLEALQTLPKVQITLGRFQHKWIDCAVERCSYPNKRFSIPEEKRTDVNIALRMLNDAVKSDAERIVLVSGDSDLVPALELIRREHPGLELFVLIPARGTGLEQDRIIANELRRAAHNSRLLDFGYVRSNQFPNPVITSTGNRIDKPADW